MDVTPERTRDERIEAYYHEGTRDLGEWLVDAEDEAARLKYELQEARLDVEYYKEWAHFNGHRLNAMIASRERYRSAWLSARRRAVDEYTHTAEALAERDAEIARLKLRESFYGGPALECIGTEEDGGTVYRLREAS
ncbi:hypothetical protein [Streptomyces xanthophaeus]